MGRNISRGSSPLLARRKARFFLPRAITGRGDLGRRKLALFLHMSLFDKAADEPAMTSRFVDPEPRRARLRIALPASNCWSRTWCGFPACRP